ncbi:hypothetical protein FRC07_006673 [Ceratobasidium sp. 392]|nr:hypothetical protein FRC07_006673 [Ceratobasidium sp. 392]
MTHIEAVDSGQVYLKLPSLFQDLVVRLDDLLDRVDDGSYRFLIDMDIGESYSVCCGFWTMQGAKVPPDTIKESRLGQTLVRNSPKFWKNPYYEGHPEFRSNSYVAYRDQWVLCFNYAVRLAGDQDKQLRSLDIYNRFYRPSENVTLSIMPSRDLMDEIGANGFAEALQTAQSKSGGVIPLCLSPDDDVSEYIQLSTNPLGLFTTWIKRDDFDALVEAQTEYNPEGSLVDKEPRYKRWTRVLPSTSQVAGFNQTLITTGSLLKYNALTSVSSSSLLQWPGQNLPEYRRRDTGRVMGDSANKSEHLLRMAVYSGQKTNYIGAAPNTHVQSAEAAITQLLFSGKTYAVLVKTEAFHGLSAISMLDKPWLDEPNNYRRSYTVSWLEPEPGTAVMYPYPHWLAAELCYTITYYLPRQYLSRAEIPLEIDPNRIFKIISQAPNAASKVYFFEADFAGEDEDPDDTEWCGVRTHGGFKKENFGQRPKKGQTKQAKNWKSERQSNTRELAE